MSGSVQNDIYLDIMQDERINLHPGHRSVFVHGFRGTDKTAKDQAHAISTYIYDHSPNSGSRIAVVDNKAKKFHAVCQEATDSLLGCIWELGNHVKSPQPDRALLPNRVDERVRLIIFCHSNGAKAVENALTPESLTDLTKMLFIPEEERASFMGKLRRRILVISFGGITFIREDYARVVMNFCSKKDYFSKFCHFFQLGQQPKNKDIHEKTYIRDLENPQEKEPVPSGILGSMEKVSCSAGAGKDLSLQSASPSIASDHPHYLNNILRHKSMIAYIRKTLGMI